MIVTDATANPMPINDSSAPLRRESAKPDWMRIPTDSARKLQPMNFTTRASTRSPRSESSMPIRHSTRLAAATSR